MPASASPIPSARPVFVLGVHAAGGQAGGENTPVSSLLGVWHSPAAQSASGMPGDPPQTILWQADLPRSASQSRQILQANQSLLLSASQALPEAERRLAAQTPADLPFANQPAGQSFSAPWDLLGDLQTGAAEAARFFDAMRLALAPQARVETSLGGRVVGRSELSWNGSVQNAFIPNLSPQQAARHRQVLAQVMLSRQSVMRLGVLIAASAASLASSAFTGPLSLLYVYQFVRDLIAEIQTFGAAAPANNSFR